MIYFIRGLCTKRKTVVFTLKLFLVGVSCIRGKKNSVAVGNVCEEADGGCGEKFDTRMQLYEKDYVGTIMSKSCCTKDYLKGNTGCH